MSRTQAVLRAEHPFTGSQTNTVIKPSDMPGNETGVLTAHHADLSATGVRHTQLGRAGFLPTNGETAVEIATFDWTATPLGRPENWPQTIKSTLATMLTSPQPMFMAWGPDLTSFFNDALRPMIGARVAGALGRPYSKLWPEVWTQMEPVVARALGGDGTLFENLPLTLTRNGYPEETWWSFSIMPLRDEHGHVLGILCVTSETTGLILSQMEMRESISRQTFRAELADSLRGASDPKTLMTIAAERLGAHLRVGCVGYAEVESDKEYALIHQDWTAENAQSVVGRHRLNNFGPAMIARLRSGHTVRIDDAAEDALTAGSTYAAAYASIGTKAVIDVPLINDGRLAGILFVLNPGTRHWTDGEVALVEEVAERTWASLQRLHAEESSRQSQKLEILGQLTGGMAHDFNNLLTVIASSVDLMRRPDLPEQRRTHYLDAIAQTVDRASKLTGHLLAFARKQPLKPEVFDVGHQVDGVIGLIRPLVGSRISVELDRCHSACFAEADVSQFETALVNLAVNARDAMSGEGRLSIKIHEVDGVPPIRHHPRRPGGFIAVVMTDTGSGIEAEKLTEIFEPFFTTKEFGKGTGLGLSQVFGFAKQSEGEIDVASELGRGTTFTLYLPRAGLRSNGLVQARQSGYPPDRMHAPCVPNVNAD